MLTAMLAAARDGGRDKYGVAADAYRRASATDGQLEQLRRQTLAAGEGSELVARLRARMCCCCSGE